MTPIEIVLSVFALLALIGCGVLFWKLSQQGNNNDSDAILREMDNLRRDLSDTKDKLRDELEQNHKDVGELLRSGLRDSAATIQTQFKQSADIIKHVTEQLTKLDETNKQVLNFSGQLQDLEKILKQPKGRGLLGEYWLETMLGHVLQPEQFKLQYKFKNGEIVDAVIFFQEKVIPIDAKFPLDKYSALINEADDGRRKELEEGFKSDLKKRIDETSKYIRPAEDTTEFAFMFLPAEGIYYDLLVNAVGSVDVNRRSLMEYAFAKKVVIVSPATFFAYLQTVLQGLKAFRMEQSVQEIRKRVEDLGRHLAAYEVYMQKLGKNMGTAVGAFNDAYGEFRKIDKDVIRLTDGVVGGTVSQLTIDRPAMVE